MKQPLVVIVGPTGTGKTSLAIKLSQKLAGEIVSADSRQVYRYLDIGTGKEPIGKKKVRLEKYDGYWVQSGVVIWLYDIIDPDETFSAYDFAVAAKKTIHDLWARGKVPFLVGGTGFYSDLLLGRSPVAGVKPNLRLREQLEKLTTAELADQLEKLNPARREKIHPQNRQRLIRAIEVAQAESTESDFKPLAPSKTLYLGLTAPRPILYQRADDWAETILAGGLVKETEALLKQGFGNSRPLQGIIYRTVVELLDGKIDREQALERIQFDLHGYIRRQLTWFKRNPEINWLDITQEGFDRQAANLLSCSLDS